MAILTHPAVQEPDTNLSKLELYGKIRSCTAKVYADFGDKAYTGSGVCVERWGQWALIVTNSHVVRQGDTTSPRVEIKAYSKSGSDRMPAYVLWQRKNDAEYFDLAFLIVRDPKRSISTALMGNLVDSGLIVNAPMNPTWRTKTVYVCGNPRGEEFLVDHGKLLPSPFGTGNDAPKHVVYHDALIEHGNSGGGLFDGYGRLMGINTWLLNDGKTGMAIDLKYQLLGWSHQVLPATGAGPDELTNPDGSEADGFVSSGGTQFGGTFVGMGLLAVGKWRPEPSWPFAAAGGYTGGEALKYDPRFNFGSLIARFDFPDHSSVFQSFKVAHRGPGGAIVNYDDARLVAIPPGTNGRFDLRMNAKTLTKAEGSMDVFWVILVKPNTKL